MRYPNTRYGNAEELKYYSQGMPIKALAKKLKRSEKSVKQWLSLEKKVPYWVPELLRLWHMERDLTMRQMGFSDQRLKLGVVTGQIIEFKRPRPLGIAQPTAQAPHHPYPPHTDNVDSYNRHAEHLAYENANTNNLELLDHRANGYK